MNDDSQYQTEAGEFADSLGDIFQNWQIRKSATMTDWVNKQTEKLQKDVTEMRAGEAQEQLGEEQESKGVEEAGLAGAAGEAGKRILKRYAQPALDYAEGYGKAVIGRAGDMAKGGIEDFSKWLNNPEGGTTRELGSYDLPPPKETPVEPPTPEVDPQVGIDSRNAERAAQAAGEDDIDRGDPFTDDWLGNHSANLAGKPGENALPDFDPGGDPPPPPPGPGDEPKSAPEAPDEEMDAFKQKFPAEGSEGYGGELGKGANPNYADQVNVQPGSAPGLAQEGTDVAADAASAAADEAAEGAATDAAEEAGEELAGESTGLFSDILGAAFDMIPGGEFIGTALELGGMGYGIYTAVKGGVIKDAGNAVVNAGKAAAQKVRDAAPPPPPPPANYAGAYIVPVRSALSQIQ